VVRPVLGRRLGDRLAPWRAAQAGRASFRLYELKGGHRAGARGRAGRARSGVRRPAARLALARMNAADLGGVLRLGSAGAAPGPPPKAWESARASNCPTPTRQSFCQVVAAAEGFLLCACSTYAPAIRAAADLGDASAELASWDVAVLAAISYRQPIFRDKLSRTFDREVSRDLIGRLCWRDLIAPGPAAIALARRIPSSPRRPFSRPSTSKACKISETKK
jgi:hypothetical protein